MMIRAKLACLRRRWPPPRCSACRRAPRRTPGSGWSQLNMTPRRHRHQPRDLRPAHDHLLDLRRHRRRGVRRHDLFDREFRKSKGAVADITLVHNTRVEVVWTIVPVIILIAMAVPAARTLVEIEDTTQDRAHHQRDRLSVGLAVRVPGRRRHVLLAPRPRAATRRASCCSGIDPNTVPHYLLERRPSAGGAGRTPRCGC